MACFYVIYRYVISEWRLIWPVEINHYDITMATHYDITMGNDLTWDIHCDITMSNDIAMCTYHGITMDMDIVINLFYYVFSALCLIMILLWVVCYNNKNRFMFDRLGWRTRVVFVKGYFTLPFLYKHNSCVLQPRMIKHELVLVIYNISPEGINIYRNGEVL